MTRATPRTSPPSRVLLAEIKTLIEAHSPQLLAERGCGPVTAAIIIGHTAGANRFPTDACFARHAGTAPIPASSGNTKCHQLHRGGDRQLNRALHIIALSRARPTPPPASTSTASTQKPRPRRKRSAASRATSPARSGDRSTDPDTPTAATAAATAAPKAHQPDRRRPPVSCPAPAETGK